MADINSLDLKSFITKAVEEIFDSMLSMNLEIIENVSNDGFDGNCVVGSVSFAGNALGIVSIHMKKEFAQKICANMLNIGEDEMDPEDVNDVIGEISNMIGGNLKSRLCDSDFQCELSIPSVTYGKEFRIENKNWARKECYGFKYQHDMAEVKVYINIKK
jgi:chemotaxis protein CheX